MHKQKEKLAGYIYLTDDEKSLQIDSLLDAGYVPTPIIRIGIRRQLAIRLLEIAQPSLAALYDYKNNFVDELRLKPIAVETDTANTQHYEVGTGVLSACLGSRMKYSACLYETGKETLDEAEVKMLESYVGKAELKDGMKILDLGFVCFSSLFMLMISLSFFLFLTRSLTFPSNLDGNFLVLDNYG